MKKYKVIFSENALADIEDGVFYYNEQRKGLGKRFAIAVQATLNSIRKNPFFAGVRYDDIRCAAVGVFPYLVHYKIETDTRAVKILSVYSTYKKELW